MTWSEVAWKSLRLQCPHCGQGRVCRGWLHLEEECSECGYDFRREPGFYLGSIYFNYGLTALLLTGVCGPLVLYADVSYPVLTGVALAFCVAFPIWFLRYARSLWLGFDYFWDRTRARVRSKSQVDEGAEPGGDVSPTEWSPEQDPAFRADWSREGDDDREDGPEPEKLTAACPYCHRELKFSPEEQGRWATCASCEQKVLLLPVRRP